MRRAKGSERRQGRWLLCLIALCTVLTPAVPVSARVWPPIPLFPLLDPPQKWSSWSGLRLVVIGSQSIAGMTGDPDADLKLINKARQAWSTIPGTSIALPEAVRGAAASTPSIEIHLDISSSDHWSSPAGSTFSGNIAYTTPVTNSNGDIAHAKISVRSSGSGTWPAAIFSEVILHELGHALGLCHTTGANLCGSSSITNHSSSTMEEQQTAVMHAVACDPDGSGTPNPARCVERPQFDDVHGLAHLYSLPSSVNAPTLSAIRPEKGPMEGGYEVRLAGSNFQQGAVVYFGSAAVPATVIDSHTLQVIAPAYDPDPTPVAVKNPDGKLSGGGLPSGNPQEVTFTYTGLKITGINPPTGSFKGGTRVTVYGVGFQPGAVVMFDGVPALPASGAINTRYALTTIAPPHALGPVSITVTNPDGTSRTAAGAYTYVDRVIVTSIQPSLGPTSGEALVLIYGQNFAPGAVVSFGGAVATVTSVTPTLIQALTAPRCAGSVSVTVWLPDTLSTTVASGYTYADCDGCEPFVCP